MINGLIFLLYVAALFATAYYFRTRGGGESAYLISNRNLNTYEVAFSAVASSFTATGVIFAFGTIIAFGKGSYGIFFALFLVFAIMSFLAPRMLELARSGNILTFSELFKNRFGPYSEKMFAIVSILLMFSFLVGSFSISVSVLDRLLGLGQFAAAVISFGIVIAYIIIGGFKAIVKTDQLQYLIMLAFVVAMVFAIRDPVPFQSIVDLPAWFSGSFFIFAPVFFWANFANPATWQPVIAARDGRTARRGLLLASFLGTLFYGPMVWLAETFARDLPGVNPNDALFEGIGIVFSPVIVPLLLLALYAAMMSSLDTALFYSAANTVKNLLPTRWQLKAKPLTLIKYFTIAFATAAILSSFFIGGFIEFVLATFPIMGVAAIPLVLSLYVRVPDYIIASAMIIGIIVFAFLFVNPPSNYLWNVAPAIITGIAVATLCGIVYLINLRKEKITE